MQWLAGGFPVVDRLARKLAKFEQEVDKYILTRIKTFAVQLARLRNGTFTPAKVKWETPGIRKFRRVDDSLNRTFRDLGNVLEDMGEPA